MFHIDAVNVFILCGALMSQIQLSLCQASPRFGIQRLPDPFLHTVQKEVPIPKVANRQDPSPSFTQQADQQNPPPRPSFTQQADQQNPPPRPSFTQQVNKQNFPQRSDFTPQSNVDIVRSNMAGPNKDGSYAFSYETSDGSKREEQGSFHGPTSSLAVSGSYSYIAPDGTLVEVKYIADERGFRAESPHIPAIPPHSLEQIRAAEEASKTRPPKPVDQKPFIEHKISAPLRNLPN